MLIFGDKGPNHSPRWARTAALCFFLMGLPATIASAAGISNDDVNPAGDSLTGAYQDSAVTLPREAPDTANMVLSIERVVAHTGHILDTLDVMLESGGHLVAGFDLRIASESEYLDILDVLPGELLDSCTWEFFEARPIEQAPFEPYPRSVWHVLALAEMIVDETRPHCYGLGRPASLLKLIVSSERFEMVPDGDAPLFFFWESCSDNSVAGVTGNTLWFSSSVQDYYAVGGYESDSVFPTRMGTPDKCINASAKNPPKRRIEFHNGGVRFDIKLEPDSSPGDSL